MSLELRPDAASPAAGTGPTPPTQHAKAPRGPRAAASARRAARRRGDPGHHRWAPDPPDPEIEALAAVLLSEKLPKGPVESQLALVVLHMFQGLHNLKDQVEPTMYAKLEVHSHHAIRSMLQIISVRQRDRLRKSRKARPAATPAQSAKSSEPPRPDTHEAARGRPVVDDPIAAQAEGVRWRDRLVFDANVSDVSPVVKGTWVTARHVITLIVEGWSWEEVLRAHPELGEMDIRACLAYTIDEEGGLKY